MNLFLKILSFFLGLLPLHRRSKSSIAVLDYMMMILVPLAYLICYGLVIVYDKYGVYHQITCDSICRTGNKLFMHMGCFLYVTIAALCLWRRKGFYVKFDEHLQEIDTLIMECYHSVNDHKRAYVKKRIYYITWLGVTGIFLYDIGFDAWKLFSYFSFDFMVTLMTSCFPYVAGSVVQAQFIYYVSVIKHRFQEINFIFEKISKECDKKNAPIQVFDIESDMKNANKKKNTTPIVKGILDKKSKRKAEVKQVESDMSSDEEEQLESSDDSKDYDENDSDSAADQNEKRSNDGVTSEVVLPDLFKLHDKILALSVITNAEYGAQAVPYMATCFVVSIFGIFLWTKVMFIVGSKNRLLAYVVQNYMVWSVTTIIVAYLVLRLCCSANAHSKQSVMIIHEIMQKKPAFMLGNDIYYNKMKSFTLQFLHWEGFFQFNGIGLFTLDYTFIFSTVSAATSYLIVLLQFDMSAILKNEGLV